MTARECADFPIGLTDFDSKVFFFFFLLKIFFTALTLVSNQISLHYVGLVERKYWVCYQGSSSFVLSNTKAFCFLLAHSSFEFKNTSAMCATGPSNRNVITAFCVLSRLLSGRGLAVHSLINVVPRAGRGNAHPRVMPVTMGPTLSVRIDGGN
jgi:hypothetical protein